MDEELSNIKYYKLLLPCLEDVLKIKNSIDYIKQNEKEFPYDYRYILLKEDHLDNQLIDRITSSYTDEELDLLFKILEDNIYKTSLNSIFRLEDENFNTTNDRKVLEKCKKEYKIRF